MRYDRCPAVFFSQVYFQAESWLRVNFLGRSGTQIGKLVKDFSQFLGGTEHPWMRWWRAEAAYARGDLLEKLPFVPNS
ncbi:MAG: hypothetical protein ACK5NN_00175 [Sphingomonadaceae bacterium]